MAFTEQISQQCGITCLPLPPASRAGNTNTNIAGWIVGPLDMGIYRRAFGTLNVGAILGAGAPNSVNVQFLAGNTSNTLCTDITNTTIWTWNTVANGPSVSVASNNNFATVEIRADQLPTGKRYLALLVNNNSASNFSAELFGFEAGYKPGGIGSGNQLNTVQGLTQSVASI